MIDLRRLAIVGLAIFVVSCGGGNSGSTQKPLTTLIVSSADPTTPNVMAIALSKGYFKANGVDVQILPISASTVITNVVSGQADLGLQGLTGALTPVASGKETSIVVAENGYGTGAYVYAQNKINDIQGCKTLGAPPVGSGSYAWANYFKTQLKAQYQIVTQATVQLLGASMSSGSIDCVIGAVGIFQPLVQPGGIHLILDPAKLSIPTNVVEAVIWGLKDNLQKKRNAIIGFLRAEQSALHDMNTLTKEEIVRLVQQQPQWQAVPASTMLDWLNAPDQLTVHYRPNKGYIAPSAWPSELEWLGGSGFNLLGGASDSKWSYGSRVDMSYLEAVIGKPK